LRFAARQFSIALGGSAMSRNEPDRQVSIDTVRGFAVLGILLMNIVGMGLPAFAYLDPSYAGGGHGANLWTWAINYTLTDGKMRGLFTMLFGASTILIAERAEGGPLGPLQTHYRRMFWLFLFGMAHAYFLWWGDILVCYALAGLFIFPLRKARPLLLILIGAGLLAGLLALILWQTGELAALRAAATAPGAPPALVKQWRELGLVVSPPASLGQQQIAQFAGSFAQSMQARAQMAQILHTTLLPTEVLEAVAQMLIGMGLYRLGFFSPKWKTGDYLKLIAFGYLVAVPVNAYLAWRTVQEHFDAIAISYLNAWSGAPRPFIALAHAGVILLLVRAGAFKGLVNRLAAAGQMALSNYLATSIITTILFCGFGFGLYGKLQRYELLYVVLGIWAFIMLWSRPWLQRFQYGPFEWVWRSLVRWRPQPWRRAPAPAGA
jgi:uncharacterized protein